MNLNLEEMQKYLKSLCEDYDKKYGRYPESSYEGRALYEHFCEENNLPCDTDQWMKDMFPHEWDM